ncbi:MULTISPECIES: PorP/SprF family type IX secretion system membrane protein [Maribacter]|uniref:PorP/SprF family type IX secretion system membrane protein n=1 Tax=Maribacter flavus TaxID=1658664 RepID=A0ABU7IKG4_9FLAO|nr:MULTISPECIES: PorP/SprF family type IX secretion system membrane protein [Maribacter]MDC6406275.1 PorP/SprF family type IX secretion system membrane protein [Maribacter sp. PR66]MEE1973395.1 PorP/SprF family type IX secretion system membrane protein [Maribacter flavus]
MKFAIKKSVLIGLPILLFLFVGSMAGFAQESNANLNSSSTYHNQLFYNRYLINPTFSLVRENKSYLNILHRNQYATFDDNTQNYFLGFSNMLNDRTAIGIGVYSQWSGVVQEFGFNANYATAVKLGDKSTLTFGTNVTYFNQGLDKNRVVISEADPEISDARKESKIAVQPGINLSIGKFDFGLYAQDLLRYNQTTDEFLTNLSTRSVKASMQYTHSFNAGRGLFEDARLMPLAQVGKNEDGSMYYLGSLLLDLPNYGWLQTTLDQEYGMSAGVGFNFSKKMSLGYLIEKDLSQNESNLGWNHEVSLAYKFKDEDMSITIADRSEDSKIDAIVRNYEEQIADLISERNKTRKKEKREAEKETITNPVAAYAMENIDPNDLAYQNRLILDELILRQDSIEEARTLAFEKKFETIVRLLRNDIKNSVDSNLQNFKLEERTMMAAKKMEEEHARRAAEEDFEKYNKLPIKMLGSADMLGVKSGYYVIANVYSNKKYLNAFMQKLKDQGLNAQQFYNKENGLYYVYLADYDYKSDAHDAYVSNLGGKYNDEKWIMQVDEHTATVSNTFEDSDSY